MMRTVMLGLFLLLFVAAVVQYPGESFQAALQGLTVWWNIVFPGLLPFYALAELLLAFGAVHALGELLDPLMRRVFRLPGSAGWAVAFGWTVGYPAGAETVARLRGESLATAAQAQRMLSLAHMPSPMLMIVVIGAGFLHRPALGAAIAAAVWLSALLLGLAQALAARLAGASDAAAEPAAAPPPAGTLAARAVQAMAEARRRDGRAAGKLLGDAITSSVQKLMTIGGLMIAGSVFVRMLEIVLPARLQPIAFAGFYEVHLGASAASGALSGADAMLAPALIAAVLGWSGWCVLLAAHSAFSPSGLRLAPFVAGRLAHAALAFALTLLLHEPVAGFLERALPAVFAPGGAALPAMLPDEGGAVRAAGLPFLWQSLPWQTAALLAFVGVLALAAKLLARNRQRR